MRPVNLIPGDQRMQATGAQSGSAYVVVGVLALLLGMVAFYVLTSNKATERQADTAAAKAQADQLEARANSLGAFATFATIKETRLASVRTVSDSRFDWERMMRELSRVIPPKGWLLEVNASTSGASGDTSTTSQTGTDSGPPAATLRGCAMSQTDVARMMTRMREMHKVSDVALTTSERSETEGGDDITGCTKYQFDVTVTFGTPASKEAPRGTKKVPASLGGGS